MKSMNAPLFLLALAGIIFVSPNFASAQIVAFGHSAVRGVVAESEMWPAVLESLLRAKGTQTHVINAGVYGETTDATLARLPSAIPAGTKTVILADNGFNDLRHHMSLEQVKANIAAIKSQLTTRGIRVVAAMPIVHSVVSQPGMRASDGIHLNVEGNKKVATILAGMVR
jgi:acyl-CoA thioesterase-1